MGANDYVLAVYAVSGTLAFGCAFLPGAGPVGRLLSILAGVGLLGWTANAYLLNGWYLTSPLIAAVPLVLLAYATFTLSRLRHSYHEEWFSPAYRARARRLAAAAPRTGPDRRGPDRRGPDRRVLPGEYG
ncbi:MAG: hypothetical protein HKP61_12725, partial [Dactylosporangium sp.]|nr:hypothetical protein [Dactylosporangium sp.]NNJ61783.1 hypothetical protein [Dactylosporangium sp.]